MIPRSKSSKCNHYSEVEEGWYCWKCLNEALQGKAKEIFEELGKFQNLVVFIPDDMEEKITIPLKEWKEIKQTHLRQKE